MIHEFTVVATGLDPEAEDFEDRFFAAACDDATIAVQRGAILLHFARSAPTLAEAVKTALAAVTAAGARPLRLEPDPLVSLSDIAARAGLTRAAVSLYARGERGVGFPAPVVRVTSESPLWDWAAVAEWLRGRGQLPDGVVEEARTLREANAALDLMEA